MTGKSHEANETMKRTPVANRKFKDTVFRMLFSDKEALLSLYNAVNNSHYTDSGALEIVTLKCHLCCKGSFLYRTDAFG